MSVPRIIVIGQFLFNLWSKWPVFSETPCIVSDASTLIWSSKTNSYLHRVESSELIEELSVGQLLGTSWPSLNGIWLQLSMNVTYHLQLQMQSLLSMLIFWWRDEIFYVVYQWSRRLCCWSDDVCNSWRVMSRVTAIPSMYSCSLYISWHLSLWSSNVHNTCGRFLAMMRCINSCLV